MAKSNFSPIMIKKKPSEFLFYYLKKKLATSHYCPSKAQIFFIIKKYILNDEGCNYKVFSFDN